MLWNNSWQFLGTGNGPEMDRKWARNGPKRNKMGQNSNSFLISSLFLTIWRPYAMNKFLTIFWDRKWTGNGPEMDRKWTRNGPEMDQNGTKFKFLPYLFIILDHLASICYKIFLTIFLDKKWTWNGPEMGKYFLIHRTWSGLLWVGGRIFIILVLFSQFYGQFLVHLWSLPILMKCLECFYSMKMPNGQE